MEKTLVNRMRLARQKAYERSVLGIQMTDEEVKATQSRINLNLGDTQNTNVAAKKSSALPWALLSAGMTAAGFGLVPALLPTAKEIITPIVQPEETETDFTIELD